VPPVGPWSEALVIVAFLSPPLVMTGMTSDPDKLVIVDRALIAVAVTSALDEIVSNFVPSTEASRPSTSPLLSMMVVPPTLIAIV
jgi:hypothetical protein